MIINSTAISANKKGRIRREIFSIDNPDKLQATNRLTAIGGVIIPAEVFTTMMIPSTSGSTPRFIANGKMIGVTSRMMACVSRKVPKNNYMMLSNCRITVGFLEIDNIVLATFSGI